MRKNVDLYTTLLLYVRGNQVLLGYKNRGFGAGTYNGFGGKVEAGESVYSALIRECQEEVGIIPRDIKEAGIINYNEPIKGERKNNEMHIYVCYDYTGKITPSEEMTPRFFDIYNLPFDKLLPDTALWMPLVLDGYYVTGDFILNDDMSIQCYELEKDVENTTLFAQKM